MTKTTNDKQNMESNNAFPGILVIGMFLVLFGAGNADYYDAAEQENRGLGYEKNIIHHKYNKAIKTMLLGSILTGAGMIGLLRKERENSK